MINEEFYISKLILADLNQSLTDVEQVELQEWINGSAENLTFYRQITDQDYFQHELKMFRAVDTDHIWELTKSRLIKDDTSEITLTSEKRIRLWPRIAIAAAMIVVVFSAGLFFYKTSQKEIVHTPSIASDILPGQRGATLTLANGKKIRLTDAINGKLADEAGVTITKSANGQLIYEMKGAAGMPNRINTLSTANGETYIVILPDQSKVWLNAASSLTYNANLNEDGLRKVKLEGEAYFEIKKDKARPFVVISRGQEIEVLGTHFNVNSYADEATVTTTLLEGSVKVTAGKKQQIIKPGQQALNNGTTIKIAPANMENVMDWKEGDFFLNHVDFKVAMRKIARWYDVEIIYDELVPNDLESGGWISRNKPLSAVLKSIESSGLAKFRVDGRKIYVTR